MSRRPATITQADVARVIRAAKKEGAAEVEVRVGSSCIVIRMSSTAPQEGREEAAEIIL